MTCGRDGCEGTLRWIRDDYGSLGSGGSYEVYECEECEHIHYCPLPD